MVDFSTPCCFMWFPIEHLELVCTLIEVSICKTDMISISINALTDMQAQDLRLENTWNNMGSRNQPLRIIFRSFGPSLPFSVSYISCLFCCLNNFNFYPLPTSTYLYSSLWRETNELPVDCIVHVYNNFAQVALYILLHFASSSCHQSLTILLVHAQAVQAQYQRAVEL